MQANKSEKISISLFADLLGIKENNVFPVWGNRYPMISPPHQRKILSNMSIYFYIYQSFQFFLIQLLFTCPPSTCFSDTPPTHRSMFSTFSFELLVNYIFFLFYTFNLKITLQMYIYLDSILIVQGYNNMMQKPMYESRYFHIVI